jgi:hypothetical protein
MRTSPTVELGSHGPPPMLQTNASNPHPMVIIPLFQSFTVQMIEVLTLPKLQLSETHPPERWRLTSTGRRNVKSLVLNICAADML